jgi:hypothetical protein
MKGIYMKKLILVLTLILAAAAGARPPVPVLITTNTANTYFSAYDAMEDTLLIKGSSTIGALNNQITYPVEIRAERLTNPQTTNTIYAVSLRTATAPQSEIDYIDYDELDALIQSVQSIAQATSAITPMDNFEAVFRTRCGLSIAKIGRGNKMVISMTSGNLNGMHNQMAPFVLEDLARDLVAAKAKIDAVVASGQ